jgi:hypothetical protein
MALPSRREILSKAVEGKRNGRIPTSSFRQEAGKGHAQVDPYTRDRDPSSRGKTPLGAGLPPSPFWYAVPVSSLTLRVANAGRHSLIDGPGTASEASPREPQQQTDAADVPGMTGMGRTGASQRRTWHYPVPQALSGSAGVPPASGSRRDACGTPEPRGITLQRATAGTRRADQEIGVPRSRRDACGTPEPRGITLQRATAGTRRADQGIGAPGG